MYKTLKTLIDNNRYEKESMLRKLDIYLCVNRITEDEYNNLRKLIK